MMRRYAEAVRGLALTNPYSGKPLEPSELTDMLKDSVETMIERPGSWENGKVRACLFSLGYPIPESNDPHSVELAVGQLQYGVIRLSESPESREAAGARDLLVAHGVMNELGISIGM